MSSSIENLMGPRLAQLQMIANHTANLRLMAELGPVIALIDPLINKINSARLGLEACEVELGALKTPAGQWSDEAKAQAVLARRKALLADLRTSAKEAADKSGGLAKMTKKATPELYQGITHIDSTLHFTEELLEALEKNIGERASAGILALVAPLTALKNLASDLKKQAQTAAGMTIDWKMFRNFGLILLGCLALAATVFAFTRPDLHPDVAGWPGFFMAVGCIVPFTLAMFAVGLLLPMMVYWTWKRVKQANAMIASGQLLEEQDKQAREALDGLNLIERFSVCAEQEGAPAVAVHN
jgi:hypothetical protein